MTTIITIELTDKAYLVNKIIDHLIDVHEIKNISVKENGIEIFDI